MSAARRLAVAWRVLRAEGAAAVRARALDRLAEAVRRQGFTPAPPGWAPDDPTPVLLVTSAPPVPWLGGVPAQLRTRLEAEQRARSIALLTPGPGGRGWRLEVRSGAERRFLDFYGEPVSPVAIENAAFEEAVRRAAEVVGARAFHAEGLAGLPLLSLRRLAGEMGIILSLHDFAAFCPRPHLLERPPLRFCEYSRDLDRCGRCLAHDWPVDGGLQAERRRIAGDLLAVVDALVFPSDFLESAHAGLFPNLAANRRVLEPPLTSTVALPRPPAGPADAPRHIALVGGVQPHKGGSEFIELVRRLSEKGAGNGAGQEVRWSSYGGGDPEMLRELRRLGVRVRGYYRHGALPHLLRRDGVDLALLLSVVPESHSLVLGECVVAGVPVVAFALGALAERVPRLGAGRLVSLGEGVEGVAAAIRDSLRDGLPEVPAESARLLTDPVSAAAGHLALYRELGLSD